MLPPMQPVHDQEPFPHMCTRRAEKPMHETILKGYSVKVLQRCNIVLAVECTLTSDRKTGNECGASPDCFSLKDPEVEHYVLLCDLSIVNRVRLAFSTLPSTSQVPLSRRPSCGSTGTTGENSPRSKGLFPSRSQLSENVV